MTADPTSTLLLEIKNAIFPELIPIVGSSVRLRSKPVMGKVKKVHAPAYVLANISRSLCSNIQENVLISPLLAKIRSNVSLSLEFLAERSEYCSFDELQRRGMDSLRKALLKTIDESQNNGEFLPSSSLSRIKQISVSSVVNKRRRQEDRWFFEPNLVAYAPIEEKQTESLARFRHHEYPQIVGCGIFDGHGGPEAAEHCSNLAPFLLSRRLQSRFLETSFEKRSSKTLPDILTDVLHELNLSVRECHRLKLWSSGTTATICLVYEDYVYTAWIGDSQGVLFKPTSENKSTATTISAPTSKSTPSHKSPTKTTLQVNVEEPIYPTVVSTAHQAADIPHIDTADITLPRIISKKQTAHPLNVEPIGRPSIAASALISPTSPQTRAARWGLSFSWLTSLVRGASSGGAPSSSKESSPLSEVPPYQRQILAPLATQEVVEADLLEPASPPKVSTPTSVPITRGVPHFRYASLPIGEKKGECQKDPQLCQNKTAGPGANVPGKRLSAHFSEPSLNVASFGGMRVDSADIAMSAGHRISPAGDMRDSRSTSVVEKSNSESVAPAYSILTPRLHRPEYATEFVSILRAGGCVTFKASEEYLEDDVETEDSTLPSDGLGLRIPAPLMSSAQLFFVPDLSVNGTYRVGGISGVTRSLGAGSSLIPGLSALPSLSAHRIHQSSSPSCLILATDGLWDTYGCTPDDLTHFFSGTPNREFAKLLTARAIRNGSNDNVTVLILWIDGTTFGGAMEVDLHSPSAYPTGTRNASVPALGDWRLRGRLAVSGFGEESDGTSAICRYVDQSNERVFERSHSFEDLADKDRFRTSSPMRVLP